MTAIVRNVRVSSAAAFYLREGEQVEVVEVKRGWAAVRKYHGPAVAVDAYRRPSLWIRVPLSALEFVEEE